MDKKEFLEKLHKGLSGLPQSEIDERLAFYSEMIDDRIEEGLSEQEAVAAIGSVDAIIAQIVAEVPLAKLAKEKLKPKRRLSAWEIVLLVAGSPIWLSLLIAVFAVVFSVYIVLWSVIVSLWAVFGAVIACAVGSILAGVGFLFGGHTLSGIAMIGAGMVCGGLSIFIFYGCDGATKGAGLLTKAVAVGIKKCFMKKEDA